MNQEISGLLQSERHRMPADTTLQDLQPRTPSQFRDRLINQLTLSAPLMRHAIRLSLALMAGYVLMPISGDAYGFWILLTIVFVCQPYYGATLTRLTERIVGTILGLIIGWALLRLFPVTSFMQSAFVVAAAVFFFVFRSSRYTLATTGITIFVLLSFNQVGDGFGLIVPRLLDTLVGSLIAGLSVAGIAMLESLRLPRLAADALRTQSRYLNEIMNQYGVTGRHDNLAYRIARRDAHNARAALSSALTAAFNEPSHIRRNVKLNALSGGFPHAIELYVGSGSAPHRSRRTGRG